MAATTPAMRQAERAFSEGREARLRRIAAEVREGRYRTDPDRLALCMMAHAAAARDLRSGMAIAC